MKKNIVLILFIHLCLVNYAQDRSNLSQFYLILPKENPGLTGIDDFLQVNSTYNQPWNGLTSNARNFSLSVFTPLGNSSAIDGIKRGSRVSDGSLIDLAAQSPSIRRRHGIGMSVESKQVGSMKETDFKTFYAYHIPISNKLNLSFGTSFGIYNQQVDLSQLTVRESNDETFQQFIGSSGRQTRLIGDLGFSLYSEKLYLAVTGKSLVDSQLSGESFLENFSRSTGVEVLGGYDTRLSNSFSTHFNLGIVYSSVFDALLQGAVRLKYKDMIYLGGSIHGNYKWSFLAGMRAGRSLYMHYAYDNHSGALKDFAAGSHQLSLTIGLFNNYYKSPASW